MKKVLSILLVIAMVISMSAILPVDATGDSTPQGTPINSAVEFAAMSALGEYYLAGNITISATYETEFSGTFDGNGKTITTSVPLFDTVSGTVKNLTVDGAINYSAVTDDAGAVSKVANGAAFNDVTNKASVMGYTTTYLNGETKALATAGGVVGLATGSCTFDSVSNEGAINGYCAGGIAGIVGFSWNGTTSFTNCSNVGTINATGVIIDGDPESLTYYYLEGNRLGTGGIVGLIYEIGSVTFTGCTNSGGIDNSGITTAGSVSLTAPAGGIYGVATYDSEIATTPAAITVSLTNCLNTASIKGIMQTGGLVGWAGYANFSATGCTNSGAIQSTASYAGGLLGRGGEISTYISNCTNETTGVVVAKTGQKAGIVGYNISTDYAVFDGCTNKATLTGQAGVSYVAGIVGVAGSTVNSLVFSNCLNEGAISSTSRVAGIVAASTSTAVIIISYCTNTGALSGANFAGGMIAYRTSNPGYIIDNCVNEASVTTTAGGCGGMVGYNTQYGGTISNCTNKGAITGASHTGGILGYSVHILTISNCLNDTTGTISGNAAGNYSGGIAARIDGSTDETTQFINCVNKGAVTSTKDNCGGIISYSTVNATFENCCNYGNLIGVACGGGMSGNILYSATFNNCYNYGSINTSSRVGGISGNIGGYGIFNNCYNHGSIYSSSNAAGISGYVTYYATYNNCINYGSVTSTGSMAAGIVSWVGNDESYTTTYSFKECGNEGNILSNISYASGIAGYLWGETTKGVEIKYCYNTGALESTASYVTGLIGYINNAIDTVIVYNYIGGTLTSVTGEYSYATIYNNETDVTVEDIHDNYCVSGEADYLRYKADLLLLNVSFPGDYAYYYIAADLASGKLANTINTAASDDAFYQTLLADTHPTTDNSHKAVRVNGGTYYNLLKVSFENNSATTYVDTESNTDFTAPESDGVLYWSYASVKVLPTGTYQVVADTTFTGNTVEMITQDTASVRITAGSTGLRFYTKIDKSDCEAAIADLLGAGFTFSCGTVIAPVDYVTEAGEFTMEALDALDKTSDKYLVCPVSDYYTFNDDVYTITGSIVNLGETAGKDDHRVVDFAAICYIMVDDGSGNSYYLYSTAYSARNVSSVATLALDDVSETQDASYGYIVTSGEHADKYSPYTTEQRAIIEGLVVVVG